MSAQTSYVQCDVELNVSAPTMKTAEKWAADALRRLADQLEAGKRKDGHYDVSDGSGRKIGVVYFDFSEGASWSELDEG